MLLCFLGSALLEDDKVFHLVRPADELDEVKSKRGSMKDKATTKAITEIYLTRLLSVKVKQQCVFLKLAEIKKLALCEHNEHVVFMLFAPHYYFQC